MPKSTDCGPEKVEISEHFEVVGGTKEEAMDAAHEEARKLGQKSCKGKCAETIRCNYLEISWKLTSAELDSTNNKWTVKGVSEGKCQCDD
jgi:hypothetical protein